MNFPTFINGWIISNRFLRYTPFWYWFRLINHSDFRMDDNERNKDFWLNLNEGWYDEYIFPYDDWYNPSYSNERRLRLAEKPPQRKVQLISSQYTGGYLAYDDNGFTICSQPNREKADNCLQYYKSKYPDVIIYGSWDD